MTAISSNDEILRANTADLMFDWARKRNPPMTGQSGEGFYDAIVAANTIADEAKTNLSHWVEAASRSGLSWEEIGEALGITKQAAYKKFSLGSNNTTGSLADNVIVVATNSSSIEETRLLRNRGRDGYELIDVGPNSLMFIQTEIEWEYNRGVGRYRDRVTHGNWKWVASRPPLHYAKREVRQLDQSLTN